MLNVPRLVISATRGGLGKTTISLGLVAAFRRKGKRVATFKKGPDFIDAGWLGAASGGDCYNLDHFLMEESSIVGSFLRRVSGTDVAVIEGNRGLFDGVDEFGTYSTARLAKQLGAPAVLIVDCTKSTGTVAAVVVGCKQFDPALTFGGVILNNIASGRQEAVIRKAIAQSSGVPVLGAVPRLGRGEFPERHMGLIPFHEHPDVEAAIAGCSDVAEKYLDLDVLWRIAGEVAPLGLSPSRSEVRAVDDRPIIGVIKDRAFQFYYPENLEALEDHGAVIREINALSDSELPAIDALYIGGGFPETQAAELAANRTFCSSVRSAAEEGLPIYAECGGLIYLGRNLRVGDTDYRMTSVLPADFVLEKKPQAHGYTILEVTGENPFFEKLSAVRGHEFHYSRIVNSDDLSGLAFTMRRGKGIDGSHDGLVYKNVLATYTHLHALGMPGWAPALVNRARMFRQSKRNGDRDA